MKQPRVSSEVRKELIVIEVLYCEAAKMDGTVIEVCELMKTNTFQMVRSLLKELVNAGLLSEKSMRNRMGKKLNAYLPIHDAIKNHYGEQWYVNVMSGIHRRLRNT